MLKKRGMRKYAGEGAAAAVDVDVAVAVVVVGVVVVVVAAAAAAAAENWFEMMLSLLQRDLLVRLGYAQLRSLPSPR